MNFSKEELVAKYGRFAELVQKLRAKVLLSPPHAMLDTSFGMLFPTSEPVGEKHLKFWLYFLSQVKKQTDATTNEDDAWTELFSFIEKALQMLEGTQLITFMWSTLDIQDVVKLAKYMQFWTVILRATPDESSLPSAHS